MIHCANPVIWLKDHFIDCDFIDKQYFENKTTVYEVLRVIQGVPLFLDAHLKRLIESVVKAGFFLSDSVMSELKPIVIKLINLNHLEKGNLELALVFDSESGALINSLVYSIPVHYPTTEQYQTGVDAMYYYAVRNNPSAKIKDQSLRDAADIIIEKRSLYEVVLVDKYGRVTEGSRSNIFFVKENALFTAPEKMVLNGITRIKVLDIAKSNGIDLQEKPVMYNELNKMDGAFLTGTSPQVLPIRLLEDHSFNPTNEVVMTMMSLYEKMIDNYILSFR
ncbi:MAG: hypothetical protein A2X11_02330 [Bacteroidetes bacterium GWE2_42_24]|nr:MAG: hypothetical protein A2X11_02330 [Bacteroidetes bacterium GWE2_42_24]OFY25412.1 MAG: hypothetical protein A2X09_02985 [Bacteroidetes bacterium GWF2_43_11]